jgi:hypothetical protein
LRSNFLQKPRLGLEQSIAYLPEGRRHNAWAELGRARERERHRVESDQNELTDKMEELKAFAAFLPPPYWENRRVDQVSNWRQPYKLIRESDATMAEFQALIDHTCISENLGRGQNQLERGRYSRLKVESVDRCENLLLWNRFKATLATHQLTREMIGSDSATSVQTQINERAMMEDHNTLRERSQLLRPQVNELFLFHGTSEANSKHIFSGGHNERFANSGLCACFVSLLSRMHTVLIPS